jgi:hypothetical protein
MRVIPDPYPIPRVKELRITLDVSMVSVLLNCSKIIQSSWHLSRFLGFDWALEVVMVLSLCKYFSVYVYGDLQYFCVYFWWYIHCFSWLEESFRKSSRCAPENWGWELISTNSSFFLFDCDFVGLYLTKEGIKPQALHSTIVQFPVPQDLKTLKSF